MKNTRKFEKAFRKFVKNKVQVLNRKSVANIFTNGVDKYSIMEYPVDNSLTIGDFEIGWNKKMTKMDIELLKKAYPNPK